MGGRGHERQFTNIRPGDFRAPDADDDGDREVQILMRRTMRGPIVTLIGAVGLAATPSLVAQQPATVGNAGVPVFRSTLNVVLVDVVVRDKSGAVVRGLTPDDFELLEDGVRQKIVTLAYEEIKPGVEPIQNASALANVSLDNRPAVAVGGNTA